jgi:hypothetical protein
MPLIAVCALFAATASGCVPPESDQFTKPVAANAAPSEPVILNGAGGKVAAHAGKVEAKTDTAGGAVPPLPSDAAASGDAPAAPAGPVLAAKPLPPAPATPAVAAAPADPSATPDDAAMAKDANGYPNINLPPKEPAAALMPADERARVISELEALRKKGADPGKDAGGTKVAKKAGAKKADGKCPDGATAATDPDCSQ